MAADKHPSAKAGLGGPTAEPRWSHRSLNIALTVLGASLCLAVTWLFYLQWQQRAWLLRAEEQPEHAVAQLLQEIDADMLRLRQAFDADPSTDPSAQSALLRERNRTLQQHLQALQTHAATDLLLSRPESTLTLEHVRSLLQRTGQWLDDAHRNHKDLAGLAAIAQGLAPQIAKLQAKGDAMAQQAADAGHQQLRSNASDILLLSVVSLLLMVLTAGTLLLLNRQRALAQEKSRKLTEYFRETQLKAETASRGKSRFLANMSHELRTPFNGIFGMLSLLGTTPLNAIQADYLKTANASANHLLNVLNDILDLSALEEGKINLQLAALDVRQVVSDISDAMRPQAEQKTLSFEVQVHPDVPQWLLMDAKRLKQILFNLANNAVKFTNQGGVKIKVRLAAVPPPDNKAQVMLVFAVEDSGIGISSDALENLFQRFNQVHHGISNDYGGTGLGLEISQSLAQLMGGHIEVTSAKGVGSCFNLHLQAPLAQAPLPNKPRKVFQPDPPPKSERLYRILVVEDNEVNRKFVDILLKRMGYLTYFAENGQVAISRLQKQSFDLVLMDLHMPVMNGIEATRAIRALAHPAAKIPIIALTADVMNDAHEEALAAGVNDFVTKPVHMGRLQDMIRMHLEPGSQGTEEQPSA